MLTHVSRAEQARNDTLIHKAEGLALNRLSDYYGFERPEIVKDADWQNALRAAVFGAKGTMGVLNDFLENMFAEYINYATYEVEVVDHSTIRYTGAEAICNFEARYVKINGQRHFTTYSDGDLLHLSLVDTTYWSKINLTDLVGETIEMQVLPYILEEHSGVVKLIIDAGLFVIPPTYLREDGEARQNEPYGGHLMDLFSSNASEVYGNQVTGAFPAYLIVEEFFGSFFPVIQNVLANSIRLEVDSRTWCVGHASIYGSITSLLNYGSVNPNAIAAVPARS